MHNIVNQSEIKASSFYIVDFLNTCKYIKVPRYQREYSWEEKNIKTLLDDIRQDYYIGNVITFKQGDDSEIIDGQQRIITIFLILIAIRNISEDKDLISKIDSLLYVGKFVKLNLEERIGDDASNILNYILDDDLNIPDSVKAYSEVKNYLYIKKILKKINLSSVYDKLSKSLLVEISFTDNVVSAHEMFVNVNTKGKPLSEIEIIKSQLFRYLLSRPSSDIYKEKWQTMLSKIPKSEYDSYVSDAFLFWKFIYDNNGENIKTSGTVKENFNALLNIIVGEESAELVFNLMTGSQLNDIMYPYSAIKNHNLEILQDDYYHDLNVSLTSINALWEMFGEFGFEQSDILFVSLFKDKETFIKNHINSLYTFMLYIYVYELSRSILGSSPAKYSNSFKQLAKDVCNIKEPSQIKKALKKFILKWPKIDVNELKNKLKDSNTFSRNYKTAKHIIMLIDDNYQTKLTVEHFIHQKTSGLSEKKYISYIGNFIPVIKDRYKNRSVVDKLPLYIQDSVSELSIAKFLEYGFDNDNYMDKVIERTNDITSKFMEKIDAVYNEILRW